MGLGNPLSVLATGSRFGFLHVQVPVDQQSNNQLIRQIMGTLALCSSHQQAGSVLPVFPAFPAALQRAHVKADITQGPQPFARFGDYLLGKLMRPNQRLIHVLTASLSPEPSNKFCSFYAPSPSK
jgi:hypothetical protein